MPFVPLGCKTLLMLAIKLESQFCSYPQFLSFSIIYEATMIFTYEFSLLEQNEVTKKKVLWCKVGLNTFRVQSSTSNYFKLTGYMLRMPQVACCPVAKLVTVKFLWNIAKEEVHTE